MINSQKGFKKPIIITIIVLVIIAGIYYVTGFRKTGIWMSPAQTKNVSAEAIAKKDVRICNSLPKNVFASIATPRADCYFEYAQATKDTATCQSMKELNLHTSHSDPEGFEGCYIEVARLKGDVTICDTLWNTIFKNADSYDQTIKGWKLSCYSGVAKTSNNKIVCNKLEGEDKLKCLIPFSNRSICQQFSREVDKKLCNEQLDNN